MINYNPRIITDGLVLCLDAANRKSYPTSGTTWTDLSRNGNNGTLINGVGYNNDNKGSLSFDGINTYVDLGNILNIGTGQFTLEYFAKAYPTTFNYSKIASKGFYLDGGWALAFGKVPGDTYDMFFQYGNNTVGNITIGISSVSLNTWYHCTVSRDSTNLISTYLNGVLKQTNTDTFNFTTNSYNYIIGRAGSFAQYFGGEPFNGNVACYRHYNRALSASEIQQNFNATKSRYGL